MLMLRDADRHVEALMGLQAAVRDAVTRSRRAARKQDAGAEAMAAVSRVSEADTIYAIDAAVDPILEEFCRDYARRQPLVLVAEGLEGDGGREGVKVFPEGTREEDAAIRLIVDPIDGTRGIMYDKRSAWALAGVAPNKGPGTRLRDVEVAVMTELPTSKMTQTDVLWAIKGKGARGIRQRLTLPDDPLRDAADALPRAIALVAKAFPIHFDRADKRLTLALSDQSSARVVRDVEQLLGYRVATVTRTVGEIEALLNRYYGSDFEPGVVPILDSEPLYSRGEPLNVSPSRSQVITHGFASVVNFFPGTKVLASELMEHVAQELVGEADVTKALVFDDQYISTGGQFYELIVGHDRFNADLRPLLYQIQRQPPGLCCHPYDCAAMLIAEEAGVILTDGLGGPLDGPLDVTTGLSWAGFANAALRQQIEPLLTAFLRAKAAGAELRPEVPAHA